MSDVRKINILVEHDNKLRQLGALAFTGKDASIYIIPYALKGRYFYGGQSIEEHKAQNTFDFTTQLSAEKAPKLSVHESGRVHVKIGQESTGPLQIPRLSTLKGEHIATICADSFEGLSLFQKSLRNTGSEIDHVIPVEEDVQSGRVAIYINGSEPSFRARRRLYVCPTRSTISNPLYIGLAPISQIPLGDDQQRRGVTIIGGWDPTQLKGAELDFLYLSGE